MVVEYDKNEKVIVYNFHTKDRLYSPPSVIFHNMNSVASSDFAFLIFVFALIL